MKRVFKIGFLFLAILGVLTTACKKDYPEPPIQVLPVGTVYTIDSILKMESGTVFTEDASVYGIVTADEQSGNLYKAAFIQERSTGKALELHLNASSGVRIGDSIRVYLKDVTYTTYAGLPQLDGFEADGHIVILANHREIPPVETTIAEVVEGKYLAGLVKLSNVMFTEKNTFAEPTTYGNRTLVDPSDFSKTVIVRTSNYANFAKDSLPQGTGSLVAIASVYNNTWQLLIRSAKELDFEGYISGGANGLPYYQDFASSFGTYTTYNVLGSQEWVIDYNTAKMTGFENGNNYPNEDWLISAPFSLEGVTSASMTMKYIARYFSNLNTDITVQVSDNYTADDPNQANWIPVPASLSEGTNWTDFATAVIDLSEFAGKSNLRLGIKYVSESKAGTIEVQSILIDEGNGPTPPTPPGPGGDVQTLPYTQSFATDFGTYTTYDLVGSDSWVIDFKTAKMTGHSGGNPGVDTPNEDWLISSPVAITGVSEAKMVMVYIARYFDNASNLNEDVTVWASTNYTYGDDPTTASWQQVPSTLAETNNWDNFLTAEISLNDYVGQTVTFAVKYLSSDQRAGTIEIQSISIEEGSGTTPPTPPTPGTGSGSGTPDDPYNVAAGIELQSDEPTAWVQGYIVGSVKSGNSTVNSNDQISWNAPFELATNVLIADDPNCREIALCLFVNLPSGKPLRTEVNLLDHPENLGKVLAVNGKLRKYFGQAGLRDSGGTNNDFVLQGGVTPPTPPTPGDELFSESFTNGQGEFTIEDVLLTGDLSYVWSHNSQYKCMKASAFVGQAHETESWLVSPAIDLTTVTSANFEFEQAVNYASPQGALFVMLSTDYTGSVANATWTELNLSAWPSGNSWDFMTSTVDLSQFAGQRVFIGFKFTSTNQASATWEVRNLKVTE